MISIEGPPTRVCSGLSRRDLLCFGSLALLGSAGAVSPALAAARGAGFGRAKSLLFISLFGGQSHHDTWDPKPDAPAEVRGEFKPIETNVSGIRICEHLPRLARMADRYTLVRSVTHEDNGHGSAMYAAFTGWPHPRPNTNPNPSSEDYPAISASVTRLRPRPQGDGLPPFIHLGGAQIVCGSIVLPGQRGGMLGPDADPLVVEADPNAKNFRVPELTLPESIPSLRLQRRRSLVEALDQAERLGEGSRSAAALSTHRERAFRLLASGSVRRALDLSAEPDPLRDRYGRTTFGQSSLLARRLLEAGVQCVTVNSHRYGNWDNHGGIFPAMKNNLLPPFDQTVSTLLTDLHERGMLEETLVVMAGEFGRSPQVNKDAGRDHWAGCYTTVFAGGGVRAGQVYGSSDAQGAYPASDAVGPWDVAATMFHLLGVPPESEISDLSGRPVALCRGMPITGIL